MVLKRKILCKQSRYIAMKLGTVKLFTFMSLDKNYVNYNIHYGLHIIHHGLHITSTEHILVYTSYQQLATNVFFFSVCLQAQGVGLRQGALTQSPAGPKAGKEEEIQISRFSLTDKQRQLRDALSKRWADC